MEADEGEKMMTKRRRRTRKCSRRKNSKRWRNQKIRDGWTHSNKFKLFQRHRDPRKARIRSAPTTQAAIDTIILLSTHSRYHDILHTRQAHHLHLSFHAATFNKMDKLPSAEEMRGTFQIPCMLLSHDARLRSMSAPSLLLQHC